MNHLGVDDDADERSTLARSQGWSAWGRLCAASYLHELEKTPWNSRSLPGPFDPTLQIEAQTSIHSSEQVGMLISY